MSHLALAGEYSRARNGQLGKDRIYGPDINGQSAANLKSILYCISGKTA